MVLADAAALDPAIRAAADEIEERRTLTEPIVDGLRQAGLFRMCVPQSVGGLELDPTTFVDAIERVAIADGSAGWCVMIGATTGLVAAYLDPDTAFEIYGKDPGVVTGGVVAPMGRGTAVDGGHRVTGRWAFGSGSGHSDWLVAGYITEGAPPLLAVLPRADVTIVDTWTVSGLRGTGSNDMVLDDVFVPTTRSFSLFADRPRETGPLYRFPLFGLLALGISAVSLGIARRSIEELLSLASNKKPTGSRRQLAERTTVQADVARAEAAVRSSRAFLHDAIGEAWEEAERGDRISVERRAALRLAATNATRSSADAVTAMYEAGGGTSIYATSPLQRCFRDAHVATQHAMVAPATYELVGRILAGLDTDTTQL